MSASSWEQAAQAAVTKDAVDASLRSLLRSADAGRDCAAAPRPTYAALCRGAMQGLVLAEAPLPVSAVSLLRLVAETAPELGADPGEALQGALEGIASVAVAVGAEAQDAIGQGIDEAFSDMGGLFRDTCRILSGGKTP